MATAKKMKSTASKAVTTKITATSRISLKKGETFYTLEFSEERTIPNVEGVDIELERKLLWDTVNTEVDNQAEDVQKMYKK